MAVGIIAEYNPFHNGHLYHLNQTRALFPDCPVVVVMSGHFVQRGEPAVADKWTRAKSAVLCGADLVIELPVLYASQSAELFAGGAVAILKACGIIDHLVFGSESGDIHALTASARKLTEKGSQLDTLLRNHLKRGTSYARARSAAMEEIGISPAHQPNDILGIEYIRQILLQEAEILPHCIPRRGNDHNSLRLEGEFASATAIRQQLRGQTEQSKDNVWEKISPSLLPASVFEILKEKRPLFSEDFFELIRYTILRDQASLSEIFEIEEGLEHLIYRSALSCSSFSELSSAIKSKRYTLSRVRRILYNILLDIKKTSMQIVRTSEEIPYIRILAFNERGRTCLKEMKLRSKANLINKAATFHPSSSLEETLFYYDRLATTIYHLKSGGPATLAADCLISPQYLK